MGNGGDFPGGYYYPELPDPVSIPAPKSSPPCDGNGGYDEGDNDEGFTPPPFDFDHDIIDPALTIQPQFFSVYPVPPNIGILVIPFIYFFNG